MTTDATEQTTDPSDEHPYRTTFEQAPIGLAHVASDGTWLRVNPRLCEIMGHSREDLLRLTFQDITFPDDLGANLDFRRQALAGEIDGYRMEKRYVRKDGTVFWALLTTSVVRDPATGALLYFISAVEDIDLRKRLEAELKAAHRVQRRIAQSLQQSLLMAPPPDLYPGLTVKSTYQGAEDDVLVGGDFFDIFAVAENRVVLVVGDITGKGLEAATYAAEVKFGLRAILREHTSPAVALTRLNKFVADAERLDPTRLGQSCVAVAVAVVDTGTGAVEAAMAGTEMPFLMRAATGEVVTFEAGGPLLGMTDDTEYGGQRDVMAEGDLLVMSTDGLTEARHPERRRQFFGAEGLAQAVREATALRPSLTQVGLAVVERAREFAGGTINDDVCLLLARRRLRE